MSKQARDTSAIHGGVWFEGANIDLLNFPHHPELNEDHPLPWAQRLARETNAVRIRFFGFGMGIIGIVMFFVIGFQGA